MGENAGIKLGLGDWSHRRPLLQINLDRMVSF